MSSSLARLFADRADVLNAQLKELIAQHGSKPIDVVTVATAYSGARVQVVPCETSRVHPDTGVAYAGIPITSVQRLLPEEIFFLLLLGRVPTEDEKICLMGEIEHKGELIDRKSVAQVLCAMPKGSDPMALFTSGLMVMSRQSHFSESYGATAKKELWRPTLDDGLTVIAQVGELAAMVWDVMHGGCGELPLSEALDLGGRLADQLVPIAGDSLRDAIRLHLNLHADHESGNVSAFLAFVAGSAHANPFEILATGALGLSGPLHGRASEQAFAFVDAALSKLGPDANDDQVNAFVRAHLASGKVVPGFGHAVLRAIDPRAVILYEFGAKLSGGGPQFAMAEKLRRLVPPLLIEQGKAKNPYPNVDAVSGSLLATLGVDDPKFFTVLFAVARSIGIMAQAVIARALVLPIVRPESVAMAEVESLPPAKVGG